jgi:hypothetical protein
MLKKQLTAGQRFFEKKENGNLRAIISEKWNVNY